MITEATGLLIEIVFISVCCIIAIVITLRSICQLCVEDALSWINKTYRNLTLIIMIMFTLSSIGDLVHTIIRYTSIPSDIPETSSHINSVIVDTLYFGGNIMFYTLILLRISQPFELNKCIIYCLSLIIFISCLGFITFCVLLFVGYNELPDKYWNVVIIVLSANDMILNIFILSIFIHKMRKTVSNIDPTLSEQAELNVNLITNVMVKHFILFGIAMFINQGWFTAYYQGFIHKYGIFNRYEFILPYSFRAVETVTNTLVLWLILRANYDRYICLCKCCHLCVGKCCFQNIGNPSSISVDNPYHQLQDL